MKKYLHLLFLALFATMSFALTSCGDDNDEPDNGNGNSSFTVNGQAYGIHEDTGATPTFTNVTSQNLSQVDIEVYPAKSGDSDLYPRVHVNIESEALPTPVAKGAKLSIKGNNSTYAEMTTGFMETTRYTEYKSGSVTVESASSTKVTLKFDNVKFADANGTTITLNGTIICDYDEF